MKLYSRSEIIKDRAKQLRRRVTLPERIIWSWLKDRKFHNQKWRKQVPVRQYILDFYCHELKLGIEIDGESHDLDVQSVYDKKRTVNLLQQGIRIIRVSNIQVLKDGESAYEYLEHVTLTCQSRVAGLTSSPRGRGDRSKTTIKL